MNVNNTSNDVKSFR